VSGKLGFGCASTSARQRLDDGFARFQGALVVSTKLL
jgi:hypothetical protein